MRRKVEARRGLASLLLTGVVMAAAIAPIGAAASSPTTLQISAYGYFGKVKSPNASCVAGRNVVLKQKGHGVLGRTTSEDNGGWRIDPADLKFKGPLPYKLSAEVKPSSKCAGATSKTITINGG